MDVSRIQFGAFKSLYDVTCELDRFTVITGPNGSGKSNLVDALNFLGEVYTYGLEFAVGRAGGYENIAHRRTRRAKRPISMEVEVRLDRRDMERMSRGARTHRRPRDRGAPGDASLVYRHRFSLGTATQAVLSDFQVKEDEIELLDVSNRQILRVWRGPDSKIKIQLDSGRLKELPWLGPIVEPFGDAGFAKFIENRTLTPAGLVADEILYFGNVFTVVRRAIGGTRLFQLSPFQCRAPGVPTPNATLERHGENLPGAADHLRRNDPSAWAEVEEAMRSIMPTLEGIEIVYTEDRRLALQFRDRGVGRPWNTGEVSDGTMQSLALFIALFDNRSPLLVIEEPENAIHPWILRQFLELCRHHASKQIIVTTHSPVLLNFVNPEIVRLMSISEGRSILRRIVETSPDLAELVIGGDVSMFDAYDSGMVEQAIPPGFVAR